MKSDKERAMAELAARKTRWARPNGIACYQASSLTIVLGGRHKIPLSEVRDAGSLVRVLFLLLESSWITGEILRGFLECLQVACEDRFEETAQILFTNEDARLDWARGKVIPERMDTFSLVRKEFGL